MRRSYVYAIGQIEARFPRTQVNKEFARTGGRGGAEEKASQAILAKVLSERRNRYLAEELRWVLTIRGAETYLLQPHDPRDLDQLLDSFRSPHGAGGLYAVIGLKGPVAPPEYCNGLAVPIVVFHQLCSSDLESLIKAISRSESVAEAALESVARELRERILRWTDNTGTTDEHRALNYLVMRYPGIYIKAAEQLARGFELTGIEARPSILVGARRAMDVIFAYTSRSSDRGEKFSVRVDITEEFPFLLTKISALPTR